MAAVHREGASPSRGTAILVCSDRPVDESLLEPLADLSTAVVIHQSPEIHDEVVRALILHYRLTGIRNWCVVVPYTDSSPRSSSRARRRLAGVVGRLRENDLVAHLIDIDGTTLELSTGDLEVPASGANSSS